MPKQRRVHFLQINFRLFPHGENFGILGRELQIGDNLMNDFVIMIQNRFFNEIG
jgi:hypothetical protein